MIVISKRKLFYTIFILTVLTLATTMFSLRYLKKAFPLEYKQYVDKYSRQYGIDPFLVYAVIKAESGFNKNAVSHKNAIGLMQILEGTGAWAADQIGLKEFSVDKLYDAETNINIGCWYLNNLNKEFSGNRELMLAAYNAGSGNVTKWIERGTIDKDDVLVDNIPYGETKRYVKKVNLYKTIYEKLYGGQYKHGQ